LCGTGQTYVEPGWGLLALLVVLPIYLWRSRQARRDDRFWLNVAAIVYLDVLLSLTFFPLPLPPYQIDLAGCAFIRLRPFATIGPALSHGLVWPDTRYLIGNVLAFVPVGVLLPLLRPTKRPWLTVLVAGFLLSVLVEVGQLLASLAIGFPYRQSDVDDVIVNTVGAAVGYALLAGARRLELRLAVGLRPD
jgi:glycopeptide antibiotics resistance protein